MSKYETAMQLMVKRFGKDELIALATRDGDRLFNRMVDAYYEDGAFYVVTYTRSKKMKQIAVNPEVAICAIEWFTGNGTGENLGWVRDEKNAEMMSKLRSVFSGWYTGGHVDEEDPNTCLLRIGLTSGILVELEEDGGKKAYTIDFVNKAAQ